MNVALHACTGCIHTDRYIPRNVHRIRDLIRLYLCTCGVDMCISQWKRLQWCDGEAAEGCTAPKNNANGTFEAVNWITNNSETNFRPALIQYEHTYSQTFNGDPVAMTVIMSEQWPDFQIVQVSNKSHSLTFQEYNGLRFHCEIRETR